MGLGQIEESPSSNKKRFDIQTGHLPNNLYYRYSQLATTGNFAFPGDYLLIPSQLSSGKQDTKSDKNVKARRAHLITNSPHGTKAINYIVETHAPDYYRHARV